MLNHVKLSQHEGWATSFACILRMCVCARDKHKTVTMPFTFSCREILYQFCTQFHVGYQLRKSELVHLACCTTAKQLKSTKGKQMFDPSSLSKHLGQEGNCIAVFLVSLIYGIIADERFTHAKNLRVGKRIRHCADRF